MRPNPADNASSETSSNLFEFALPEIGAGEGPIPLPEPSYELTQKHARFLLQHLGKSTHHQSPVHEPFVFH